MVKLLDDLECEYLQFGDASSKDGERAMIFFLVALCSSVRPFDEDDRQLLILSIAAYKVIYLRYFPLNSRENQEF